MNKKKNEIRTVSRNDINAFQLIFFGLAFIYFCFFSNYVLYFQETQFLFIFSGEYLHDHLLKPGGLLEYVARFLSQFYHSRIPGSVIISVILSMPLLVIYQINRRLVPGVSFSLVLMLIPSLLLLLVQSNYYHLLEYNIGFLMILVYYLYSLSSAQKLRQVTVVLLFPVIYYITGAYALVFGILYIVHCFVFNKGKDKILFPLALLLIAGISVLASWKFLFLQPLDHLIMYPFPLLSNRFYIVVIILLTAFIVLYPATCRIVNKLSKGNHSSRLYSLISSGMAFAVIIFFLVTTFNLQTARVVKLERLVYEEKWKDAIALQEKRPAKNLIGEYFYNVALSETGQLLDRLFFGPQDFLAGSLVLPWGDIHLDRGAYFYYTIGLMNEAHRWAYEEMVVFGYRPQNMRMLAKTSLISGDYQMAKKYLGILEKTIYYRKWARECEKLADNPELIKSDKEFGPKLKLLPHNNFFIQFNEPQNNLPLVLEGQPANQKAIEYYLAGLLLTKKVEIAVSNIKDLRASGYTRIPRHLEEAAMIYYNSMGVYPDLGGLPFSNDTQARFGQYYTSYQALKQNETLLKERLQKNFGNTFWYYFHFR